MKVLLVTPFYKDSVVGPGKFAVLIKGALPDLVDILTENTGDNEVYSVEFTLNYFERKLTQCFNRKYYHKKINEILHSHPHYTHVIFINGILGYGFKPSSKTNARVVHMINDEQFAILKFYPRLRYFAERIYVWMEMQTIQTADVLIVNSEYLKVKLITHFGIRNPEKIKILHKAINLGKYPFNPERVMDTRQIKLLFVKFDWRRGGLEDIADALRQISEMGFVITVAGPLDSEKENIIDLFCNLTHVELIFVGRQSEENIINLMKDNDILCIPSRSEALGVAIIEGLASGIPVVTTSAGGIKEVTDNGKFVWESKIQNSEYLAVILQKCIQSVEERKLKAMGGRKFVEENYDVKIMEENFIKILSE